MKTCLHLIHVQYTITVRCTVLSIFFFFSLFILFNKGVGVGGGGAFPDIQVDLTIDCKQLPKKPFVLNFFFLNLCEQQNIHIDLFVLF